MKGKTGVGKLSETAKQLNTTNIIELFTPVYITETYHIYESKINKKKEIMKTIKRILEQLSNAYDFISFKLFGGKFQRL